MDGVTSSGHANSDLRDKAPAKRISEEAMPDPFAAEPAASRSRCYGLLYVDRTDDKDVNPPPNKDPAVLDVGSASPLAASARWAGKSFTVLINAADEVHRIVAEQRVRDDVMRHGIGKSALRAPAEPVPSLAEGERKYAPRA